MLSGGLWFGLVVADLQLSEIPGDNSYNSNPCTHCTRRRRTSSRQKVSFSRYRSVTFNTQDFCSAEAARRCSASELEDESA